MVQRGHIGRGGGHIDRRAVGFGTIGGEEAVFVGVERLKLDGCRVDECLFGGFDGKRRGLVLVGAGGRGVLDGRFGMIR